MKVAIKVTIAFYSFIFVVIIISAAMFTSGIEGESTSGDPGDGIVIPSGEYIFPLEKGYITSSYGKRTHPKTGELTYHYGIDSSLTAEYVAVHSFSDGVVSSVGYDNSRGHYIYIHHIVQGENYTTAYYHFKNASVFNVGNNVNIGDVLGQMGTTGDSTGIHLHFEISNGHNLSYLDHISNCFDPYVLFGLKVGDYFEFDYTTQDDILDGGA